MDLVIEECLSDSSYQPAGREAPIVKSECTSNTCRTLLFRASLRAGGEPSQRTLSRPISATAGPQPSCGSPGRRPSEQASHRSVSGRPGRPLAASKRLATPSRLSLRKKGGGPTGGPWADGTIGFVRDGARSGNAGDFSVAEALISSRALVISCSSSHHRTHRVAFDEARSVRAVAAIRIRPSWMCIRQSRHRRRTARCRSRRLPATCFGSDP